MQVEVKASPSPTAARGCGEIFWARLVDDRERHWGGRCKRRSASGNCLTGRAFAGRACRCAGLCLCSLAN